MTQAQAVQELEIGPQFISLGSSTIQTRNIASVAISPDPKDVRTQVEWDRKQHKLFQEEQHKKIAQQKADATYYLEHRMIINNNKRSNDANREIRGIIYLLVMASIVPVIIYQVFPLFVFWYVIIVVSPFVAAVFKMMEFFNELKAANASKTATENAHRAMLELAEESINELKRHQALLLKFSVIITTNSATAFSIQCANLEYAYDLKRRFDAALGGTDVAVYHIDSRTQNIQMVVHANIKIEINNDIDQIISRLEQLRADDRAELKAYLDDVRLIANSNAISKAEAKETQTKLDIFLDKYRKVVGAANDTVELVSNIKKALNPFW